MIQLEKRGRNAQPTLKVSEASIEKGITTILELDGFWSLKLEQNFSERKMKCVGEAGMADRIYIRFLYPPDILKLLGGITKADLLSHAQVLFIEHKARKGRLSGVQRIWHEAMRKRGALTWIAGIDFPASIEGFLKHYESSGLQRRKLSPR